jgi:hypothetical protein
MQVRWAGVRSEIVIDDFPATPHTFEPFNQPGQAD